MSDYMVGYDYKILSALGIKVPIEVSPESHMIIVGGSGSGKSTALLYFLYKMMKSNYIQLTICDFKASHEFNGITYNFAEFENCYGAIRKFYAEFLSTPEGGEPGGIICDFEWEDYAAENEIAIVAESAVSLYKK